MNEINSKNLQWTNYGGVLLKKNEYSDLLRNTKNAERGQKTANKSWI